MVQEFNVVRCYSCQTFQVEQVKKSTNKWSCKICHEKQSLKQIFFTGSGKECRINCQSLNMKRMENEERQSAQLATETDDEDGEEEDMSADILPTGNGEVTNAAQQCHTGNQLRDWQQFLEEDLDSADEGDSSFAVEFRGEHKHKSTNKTRKRNNKKCGSSLKNSMEDTYQIDQVYQLKSTSTTSAYTQNKRCKLDDSDRITKTGESSFLSSAISERPEKFPLRDVTDINTKPRTSVTNAGSAPLPQSKWSQFLSVEEEDVDEDDDDLSAFVSLGNHLTG